MLDKVGILTVKKISKLIHDLLSSMKSHISGVKGFQRSLNKNVIN